VGGFGWKKSSTDVYIACAAGAGAWRLLPTAAPHRSARGGKAGEKRERRGGGSSRERTVVRVRGDEGVCACRLRLRLRLRLWGARTLVVLMDGGREG
jgi:hypothetical protein